MSESNRDDASGGPASAAGPARFLGRWTVRAIRLAEWAGAGLTLVGFAGAISRSFDLASHFRVSYALSMIAAVATHAPALRRTKGLSLILAGCLALDVAPIATLYLPRTVRPAPAATALRLLQFNAWERNADVRQVLPLLQAELPDVVALEEATATLRTAVEDALADRYHVLSNGSELLLLIRRDAVAMRLLGHERHVLPGGEAISARLDIGGRGVEILCLHAMAPLGLQRAAIRDAQLEWVAHWSRSRPGEAILLGDLNTSPWSHSFGRLLRDGGLVDSERGFGVRPTWRARFGPFRGALLWPFQVPIDHCLHSPNLIATSRSIGPACGSNHYPLLVTLQFADVGESIAGLIPASR